MGYNGGKRVWPQRNSGFSKSSIRFGNMIFRKVSLPILKIGFSAIGLSNSNRKKNYRGTTGRPRSTTNSKNQLFNNKYSDNKSSYSKVNYNSFFCTSNIAQFSNVVFEPMLNRNKGIIVQNMSAYHDIKQLAAENISMRSRISSIYMLRLFYKKEIENLEFNISENENKISALKESVVDECLDFKGYNQLVTFTDLFDLIKSSNLHNSSWIIYPKANVPFRLDNCYLNYSVFFQRSRLEVLKTSIPFINDESDKYVCIRDSNIAIAFLSCAVLIFTDKSNFALLKYSDFECKYKEVIIKENEPFVASEAIIDSLTWLYQKMDGSPDLRYKNNPQVPIVRYSNVTLETKNGIHIEFLFLNLDFGRLFSDMISKMSNESQDF